MFLTIIQSSENISQFLKGERIYHTYKQLMYSIAHGILEDVLLSEEAVYTSLEKIIKNIHCVSEVNSESTKNFVSVVCRHTAIDILRKRQREIPTCEIDNIPDTSNNPEEAFFAKESVRGIMEKIMSLPEKYKNPLYLRITYQMSYKEIGKTMGISVETVKKRLQRAKKMVKDKMREEELI